MKKILMLLLAMSTIWFVSCGDTDDATECTNTCKEADSGTTQCTTDKKAFETCTRQPSGCYEWVKTECTGSEVCVEDPLAACGVEGDNNVTDCSADANACTGNTNGLTECKEGVCSAPADNNVTDCSSDANVCTGNTNGLTVCKEGVCSTPDDNNVTDCSSDADCEDNTDGNTVCKDDDLCGAPSDEVSCTSDADCVNAPNGPVCKGDGYCGAASGAVACTSDGCEPDESGTTQCSAVFVDIVQTCTLQTTLNCYKWEDTTDCSGQSMTCVDNGTVPAACGVDVK